MTATKYQAELEVVMNEFEEHAKICTVTCFDNESCLNSRCYHVETFHGVVGVDDQLHMADLLINDVGKIALIQEVNEKVDTISSDLHRHRKLKEHFSTIIPN